MLPRPFSSPPYPPPWELYIPAPSQGPMLRLVSRELGISAVDCGSGLGQESLTANYLRVWADTPLEALFFRMEGCLYFCAQWARSCCTPGQLDAKAQELDQVSPKGTLRMLRQGFYTWLSTEGLQIECRASSKHPALQVLK